MINLQNLLAEAQARADANGDGKLSIDDVRSLADEHGVDSNMVEDIKSKIDHNSDGKLSIDDLKSAAEHAGTTMQDASSHIQDTMRDTKDRLFGHNNM